MSKEKKSNKVNKESFLESVAKDTGMSVASIASVYNSMVKVAEEVAVSGKELSLTGFGRFYLQRHKGHPVQFGTPSEKVHDYVVYKFSASNVLNNKLREIDREQSIAVGE